MTDTTPQVPDTPASEPAAAAAAPVRFQDFDLEPTLMRAIADLGFTHCTPIQAQVLGHTLAGADAIGRAQTGTGKTAAFLITVINDLLRHPLPQPRYAGEPRALVIAPTRELALQIEKDAHALCKYTDLQVMNVVGGMNFTRQQERLQNTLVDILVATPGRLLDFCNRRDLWLDRVEVLVLDEADRMLDMGFIPDVKRIVRYTPVSRYRQTLLFSATFNQDVMNLAQRWTQDPVVVEIEAEHVTTDSVDQKVYITETSQKYNLLHNLIVNNDLDKVMVFANRRDITRRLCERLQKAGLNAAMLSGDVPQNQRLKTLERFRNGAVRVLIATDVAGRGIHIDGVSHVVNYNLPDDPEDYVHRIGRTGRAGATGTSISFACEDDAFLLPALEAAIGMKLPCEYPPAELLGEPAPTSGGRRQGTRATAGSEAPPVARQDEVPVAADDTAPTTLAAEDAGDDGHRTGLQSEAATATPTESGQTESVQTESTPQRQDTPRQQDTDGSDQAADDDGENGDGDDADGSADGTTPRPRRRRPRRPRGRTRQRSEQDGQEAPAAPQESPDERA